MTYRLPLAERLRFARNKRARYWSDADYRLTCINKARAQRGAAPIRSLLEMGDPREGRRNAMRDARGRFARHANSNSTREPGGDRKDSRPD